MCIKNSQTIEYTTINTLEGASTIEYFSPGYPDLLKDLGFIFLRIKCQIVKSDDTLYTETDEEQPLVCSNLLYAM